MSIFVHSSLFNTFTHKERFCTSDQTKLLQPFNACRNGPPCVKTPINWTFKSLKEWPLNVGICLYATPVLCEVKDPHRGWINSTRRIISNLEEFQAERVSGPSRKSEVVPRVNGWTWRGVSQTGNTKRNTPGAKGRQLATQYLAVSRHHIYLQTNHPNETGISYHRWCCKRCVEDEWVGNGR